MDLSRRSFILAPAGLLPAAALAQPAPATIPGLPERSAGDPDAPVTVTEFFSLTCNHCAAWHLNTWPRVRKELVENGQLRMVWRDFPLDGLALEAAQVSRALPPEAYESFVTALFAAQDRWAFDRDADTTAEIARLAALAGLQRWEVEAAMDNENLRLAVMESRRQGELDHNITRTPSFIFPGGKHSGTISFERFVSYARAA